MSKEVEDFEEVNIEVEDFDAKPKKPKAAKKSPKKYTEEDFDAAVAKAIADKAQEKRIALEAEQVSSYKVGTLLTDISFLMRLKNLSLPKPLLVHFRDEDRIMSDAQIWDRVRPFET